MIFDKARPPDASSGNGDLESRFQADEPNNNANGVKTFGELFCEAYHIDHDEFSRKVFWQCLYRHALPLVPFWGGFHADYFAADHELILSAGRAASIRQVREEVADYFQYPNNHGWLRKRARIRISTKRLVRLARRYLTTGDSRPPAGCHDHNQ